MRSFFRVRIFRLPKYVLYLQSVLSKQDLVLHLLVIQVLRQSLVARPSPVTRSALDAMSFVLRKVEGSRKGT